MNPGVTLVYFSCEGREHLLARTVEALAKFSSFPFHTKILAFDGPFAPGFSVAGLGINKLVNNVTRAGYVPSIRDVLPLITTPYFFWQEDDCRFLRRIDIAYLLEEMESNPDWVQIGWGIGEKFPAEEKVYPLGRDSLYQTAYGFSARPALCRTDDLLAAFTISEGEGINLNQDVEEYLRKWLQRKAKLSVSIDPGESIYLHEGQLESVDKGLLRMKPRAAQQAGAYISNLGHQELPSMTRRIKNLCNLLVSALRLCMSQFYNLRRYDVAWRVVSIERATRV